MAGILAGIKVVDAGSFLAGPCVATIMSDYGAEVLKIEPLSGDRHDRFQVAIQSITPGNLPGETNAAWRWTSAAKLAVKY